MQDFKLESLKEYLGFGLVDMLVEWTQETDNILSKSKLIDLIEGIHGLNVFKNKEFRRDIILRLDNDDLLSFQDCLRLPETKKLDMTLIRDMILSKNWGSNRVSNNLLRVLEIESTNLVIDNEADILRAEIDPHDRFYELLDYQFIIKKKILRVIESDVDTPRLLVHMPTGTGKTKTCMHTLVDYFNFTLQHKGIIIWLAHSSELLEQAYESFTISWKHLGLRKVETLKIWGSRPAPINVNEKFSGVIFAGFQKILSIMKNQPLLFDMIWQHVRLVVVDEAHKAVAEETKKLISELMRRKAGMENRALIGLSATPGRNMDRSNGENQRLVSMFENRIITVDLEALDHINLNEFERDNLDSEKDVIRYMQKRKILASITREKLSYDLGLSIDELNKLRIEATVNGYCDYSKEFLLVVGRNKKRNLRILNRLIQLDLEKIPTIVFACSVEHGKLLSAALSSRGISNQCVFGDMSPIERRYAIQSFKDRSNDMNILINYEVLTTGFDSTNIRCVFITRPTNSIVLYSQMLGRGLRGPRMGGNENCLLIDIEDNLERYTDEAAAFSYFDNYWGN